METTSTSIQYKDSDNSTGEIQRPETWEDFSQKKNTLFVWGMGFGEG